jgi:hypothetical protein
MYLKEIEDKETRDMLENSSCDSCGLVPIFKSELMSDGVKVTVSFNDNVDWLFILNKEKNKLTEVYCPICTRKMKLLKLKDKI